MPKVRLEEMVVLSLDPKDPQVLLAPQVVMAAPDSRAHQVTLTSTTHLLICYFTVQ